VATTPAARRPTAGPSSSSDGIEAVSSRSASATAESSQPGHLEREVTVVIALEPRDSFFTQERVRKPSNRVRPGRRQLFDWDQCRGHTKARRPVHREKNVGRAAPQRKRQEVDDLERKPFRPDGTVDQRPREPLCAAHGSTTLTDSADRATNFWDLGVGFRQSLCCCSSEFQSRRLKILGAPVEGRFPDMRASWLSAAFDPTALGHETGMRLARLDRTNSGPRPTEQGRRRSC
jgi:hypothetical protein